MCTIATNDAYGQDLTELVLAELSKTNVSVIVTEKFHTKAHAGIVRPKVAKVIARGIARYLRYVKLCLFAKTKNIKRIDSVFVIEIITS